MGKLNGMIYLVEFSFILIPFMSELKPEAMEVNSMLAMLEL